MSLARRCPDIAAWMGRVNDHFKFDGDPDDQLDDLIARAMCTGEIPPAWQRPDLDLVAEGRESQRTTLLQ